MFGLFKRSEPVTDSYELLKSLGIGAPTASGKHVNSETAQCLPAVYCAVSTIAEAVAAIPIHVYQKEGDGERKRSNQHHAERLLNVAPNEYQTAYDFKLALMRAVLLRGNGYILINHDMSGRPQSLHLIHPDSIILEKLSTGRIGYLYTDDKGKQHKLLQEQVIHIKYHSDDGLHGKSPITVCRETVGLGIAQQEFGASQFKNGVKPSGVLEFDKWLNPKQIKDLSEHLQAQNQGSSNTGKTLILEGGMKWKPIGLTNQDAEWLQSRLFTVSDVARMFKISPIFLMDYSNSTYSNFGEASRAFLSQSLRPWLSNLQQAFASRLISERNRAQYIIEFETKDILRATTMERYEVYDIAIRNGLMNPNECRKSENLPKREGGDEYSQSWNQQAESNETQNIDN